MVEHDSLNDTQPRLATTQPACEGIVQEARRRTVPVAPLPANFDCEDDLLRGPCGGALSPSASDAPRDHPTHQAHLLGFTPPSSLLLGPAHSAFAPDPSFTLEDDDSVSGHLHRLDPRRHKKLQSTTQVHFSGKHRGKQCPGTLSIVCRLFLRQENRPTAGSTVLPFFGLLRTSHAHIKEPATARIGKNPAVSRCGGNPGEYGRA
ncbi:hypothetical protein DIPPA_14613 [Diplonema papillatum]|nr:hypothetical protein DIPPA_14613 [Diplonema papillatum]